MADKPRLNVFGSGSASVGERPPGDTSDLGDLDAGRIRPVGVGLRIGEIVALDNIAQAVTESLGAAAIARNAIARIAIRRFIEDFQAGKIEAYDLVGYFQVPDKPAPKLKFNR